MDTLTNHFFPKPAERFRFHRHNQEECESVIVSVAALRNLVEHCEFRDALNDALRDRLVCRLKDEAAQKKLLTQSDLTRKAINPSGVTIESKEVQQQHGTGKVQQ